MSELDWSFVKETLADALELAPERRADFVALRCSGRPDASSAVLRLMRGHEEATGFLDESSGARASEPDRPPPEDIGPYRLHEAIGEGGFGVVYRAAQMHPFVREVAVKVLKPASRAAAIVERFRVERDALAKMDHEDICRVLDAGLLDDGRPFVVMELVRGLPISQFVRDHRVDLRGRIELLLRAARAVHHAHQRAVVHCDVKPSNILVAQEGGSTRLRLIDFGIARAFGEHGDGGSGSDLAGTPRYMSPERRSALGPADVRSDVYSLGAVLDELTLDAERAQLARPRRLHRDARMIAAKAVAEQPAERYDSAAALADDLERALRDLPLRAEPPRVLGTALRFVRRHRLATFFGATAAAAVLLGAGVAWHGRSEALRAEERATRQARRAELARDFLLDDMLGSLDPNVAQGRDVTVVELLSRVRERMEPSLGDDPRLLADVAATLGRAYAHLGRDADAISAYELALATRTRIDAESEPSLEEQAEVLSWRVDLAAAMMGTTERHGEGMSLRAWNAFDASNVLGPWHPVAMRARLVHTPQPLDVAARTEELRALLARARELGPEGAPLAEDAARTLATIVGATGSHDEAITLLEGAIASAEERLGPGHSHAIVLRKGLADACFRKGDFDRANMEFDRALERTRAVLPVGHPSRTGLTTNVGLRKLEMGRSEEAHALLAEVATVVEAREGAGSIQHTGALLSLGQSLVALGRHDEASAMLAPIVAAMEAHWGPRHAQTARTVLALARAERGRGNLASAERLAADAADRIGLGRDVGISATLLRCELLVALDRPADAETVAAAALAELPPDASNDARGALRAFTKEPASPRAADP